MEAAQAASGHHKLEGTWRYGLLATTLTVDVEVGAPMPIGEGCGGWVQVPATGRVHTSDGLVDAVVTEAVATEPQSVLLVVPVPNLPMDVRWPDPNARRFGSESDVPPLGTLPSLVVKLSTSSTDAALYAQTQDGGVGRWSSDAAKVPRRALTPYVVPALLEPDCVSAAAYGDDYNQRSSFASEAELTAAFQGNWTRCRDHGGPAHAGLQITTDGKWRHLMLAGSDLVEQGGLEHEGGLKIYPNNSSPDAGVSFLYFTLESVSGGSQAFLWKDMLITSSRHEDAMPQSTVYVRTNRTSSRTTPPFTSRQRAGEAACGSPEEGLVETTSADLNAALAGDWTLCAGELLNEETLLRFDGTGGVRLFDAAGSEIASTTYLVDDKYDGNPPIPPAHLLRFPPDSVWAVALSDKPLKLWLRTNWGKDIYRTGVFSAMP